MHCIRTIKFGNLEQYVTSAINAELVIAFGSYFEALWVREACLLTTYRICGHFLRTLWQSNAIALAVGFFLRPLVAACGHSYSCTVTHSVNSKPTTCNAEFLRVLL